MGRCLGLKLISNATIPTVTALVGHMCCHVRGNLTGSNLTWLANHARLRLFRPLRDAFAYPDLGANATKEGHRERADDYTHLRPIALLLETRL
jgi:hypothetical protein